jgi:hypothetical protein
MLIWIFFFLIIIIIFFFFVLWPSPSSDFGSLSTRTDESLDVHTLCLLESLLWSISHSTHIYFILNYMVYNENILIYVEGFPTIMHVSCL